MKVNLKEVPDDRAGDRRDARGCPGLGVRIMRKPLTLKERCELLWIRRLQQLNCYEQLVRKLSERRSLSSVARWAIQLGIEGEASRWSFHTWRRYLGALEKRVSRIVVRQERVDVRPLEFQAVMEEVERQTDALIAMPEAIGPGSSDARAPPRRSGSRRRGHA